MLSTFPSALRLDSTKPFTIATSFLILVTSLTVCRSPFTLLSSLSPGPFLYHRPSKMIDCFNCHLHFHFHHWPYLCPQAFSTHALASCAFTKFYRSSYSTLPSKHM